MSILLVSVKQAVVVHLSAMIHVQKPGYLKIHVLGDSSGTRFTLFLHAGHHQPSQRICPGQDAWRCAAALFHLCFVVH